MQLTRMHRVLVGVVVAGAVIIAGIGFAGSYTAVRELAEKKGFGDFSLVFPIGIDAGICVLLALDLLLTWLRIPFPLLRQTAWILTAATIAFNGAAAWPDPLGVGMHAVIPMLFVVSVEAARHAVGRIADITADKHMEGVRLTRWLLSPVPTFRLWRRMKLWELRSYEQVIKLEQDRMIYQARLQARYGRGWRRKAPVEALMPLRLARFGVPIAETAAAGLAAAGIEPVLLPPSPGASAEPGAVRVEAVAGGSAVAGPAAVGPAVAGELPRAAGPEASGREAEPEAEATAAAAAAVPVAAEAPAAAAAVPAPATAPAPVRAEDTRPVPADARPRRAAQAPALQAQAQPPAAAEAPAPTHPQPQPHPQPQAPLPAQPGPQAQPGPHLRHGHEHEHPAQPAPEYGPQPEAQPVHEEAHPVPTTHHSPWFAAPKVTPDTYTGTYSPTHEEPEESEDPAGTADPADSPDITEEFGKLAYDVFRTYARQNGSWPSADVLGIHLTEAYGVQHPRSAALLRRLMPEFKTRYQAELEAEHIA